MQKHSDAIFYEVDPSDVRKQTGDFGRAFKKSCASKTKEERQRWIQALIVVGNIAGEYLLNWLVYFRSTNLGLYVELHITLLCLSDIFFSLLLGKMKQI